MTRRSVTAAFLVLLTAVAGAAPPAQADSSGWGPVVDLTRSVPAVYSVDVAAGLHGKVVAAWVHGEGDRRTVRTARRLRDGTWADAARVPGSRGATEVQVDVLGDGTIMLVWTTRRAVNASQKAPGRAWTAPVLLHRTASLRFPSDLQVAVNVRGRAGVAWQSVKVDVPGGDAANRIQAVVGKGERWSRTRALSDPDRPAGSPAVAVDRAGRVTVVWNESNGHRWLVRTASRQPASGWTRTRALSTGTAQPGSPEIAATAAGDVAVVWALEEVGIELARWERGRGWNLTGDTLALKADVWWFDVGLAGDGAVTVGWANGAGAIRAATLPPGGAWQQQRVAPARTAYYGVDLAVNRRGDAVLTWQAYGQRDRDHPAQVAYRPRSSRWTPATALSPLRGDAFGPTVAILGGGDAVAGWAHQPDARPGVRAQVRSFSAGG